MNGQTSETALSRMLAIVDEHDKAKWFPPSAFNVAAWALACGVSDSTIDAWLNRNGAAIVRRPGGGSKAERYVALEDFWPAIEASAAAVTVDKPKPRRRSA